MSCLDTYLVVISCILKVTYSVVISYIEEMSCVVAKLSSRDKLHCTDELYGNLGAKTKNSEKKVPETEKKPLESSLGLSWISIIRLYSTLTSQLSHIDTSLRRPPNKNKGLLLGRNSQTLPSSQKQ